MRKVKHLSWLVLVLALFLTGCGTDSASSEETGSEEKKTASPEEILEKTNKASKDLRSYSMSMSQEMEVTAPDGTNQLIETSGTTIAETDPMAMYIDMTTADQDIEMYVKDNIMYMNEPVSGSWIKLDIGTDLGSEYLNEQLSKPIDEQIQQVKDLAESIKVTENSDSYTMDIKIAADKMNEFLETQMGSSGMDMSAVGDVEYDKFNYAVTIDKETYYPHTISLEMNMNITVEGETGQVKMVSDNAFADYNETEPIEIPAEAESAADLSDYPAAS
jgi:outer membrane lipoprotein-sorting protein